MNRIDDEFRALRDNFVRGSNRRIEAIETLISSLSTEPDDPAALEDLYRAFHTLVGLGTTYGFPAVTNIARKAEIVARNRIQGETSPDRADLTRWRDLLNGIESELRHGSSAPFSPFDTVSTPTGEISRIVALIVEDDPDMQNHLRTVIEQEGLTVITSRTRAEAIQQIAQGLPDLAIVDVKLPDGSGYGIVRHMRELPGGDGIPILVVSVLSGFLDRVEAIRSGADGFFEKPVKREPFVRRIRHLVGENQLEAPLILYVEDDPDYARLIDRLLTSAGYDVRICPDPTDFEKLIAEVKPDLVILDVLLPKVSGYDLARYLRQDDVHAVLPILFLTTEANHRASIESVASGGDDHLIKPIEPAVLLRSVAARIERSRYLKSLLEQDGLTGLLTHTRWVERVNIAHKEALRHPDRPFTIAMVDIDHFKAINDQWGHPAGDRMLASLGSYLRKRLRQTDAIGRYGGDEFGIVLSDLTESDSARLLDEIRTEFAGFTHPVGEGDTCSVTLSIGTAQFDSVRTTSSALWIERADEALYAAKDAGRNLVACVTTGVFRTSTD